MVTDAQARRDAMLVLWGFDLSGYIPSWLVKRAEAAVRVFDETGKVEPRPTPTAAQALAFTLSKHTYYERRGRHYCTCGVMFIPPDDHETHIVTIIQDEGWRKER